ncbi:amidase [Reyranella sp. MMS21-HV4-11]|uniref:Amidase n=1 Tax=Reyranella humidisoli TaxID=2849149 RepID=A0ABS6IDF5_9HYPH|nr:amidase family protein [Reyranella sp. MMS21-HV4-11]MBU8872626.1 amidase [Reyranella sp. MMS21-HV4-11]
MSNELWRLTAVEAVSRLRTKEITPLDLVEASARRMEEVEPAVNAMPTLCLDRARDHAKKIMAGQANEAEGEAGWLAGLPVSIKDLTDVGGVRTTYGSPIFANHVPEKSHPLVERIERKGGIVMGKSNTPEFGAGGSTFNEVFGRTRNPWNTSLTCGGSTGGGSVSVATGEVWLAHGSDHGGSLRRPGTYCSTVGLRPSAGRVTRGTSNNLYSPQSVQGPMARNVADLALFLDTMSGFCPQDAMTFDAPAVSFSAAVANPVLPKRVAFTIDFGGRFEVDREIREICTKMAQRFEELGCIVEEVSPDFGPVDEVFMAMRSQQFVVDRELQIQQHRDKFKPDIIWNTELGLKQTTSQLAWAERERAALYRRMFTFFQTYDLLVTPGAPTAAFDVNLRAPATIAGKKLDNYMSGSTLNSAITVTGSPAIAVPCGFDSFGRPVGLQLVGKPRGEAALLQAAALYEKLVGFDQLLPIDPRPGTVPPSSL